MITVRDLVEEAIETLHDETSDNYGKLGQAIATLRVVHARLNQDPIRRASRLLFEEMSQWATFEKGTVRVEVICDLLQQEGLLVEEDDRDDPTELGDIEGMRQGLIAE